MFGPVLEALSTSLSILATSAPAQQVCSPDPFDAGDGLDLPPTWREADTIKLTLLPITDYRSPVSRAPFQVRYARETPQCPDPRGRATRPYLPDGPFFMILGKQGLSGVIQDRITLPRNQSPQDAVRVRQFAYSAQEDAPGVVAVRPDDLDGTVCSQRSNGQHGADGRRFVRKHVFLATRAGQIDIPFVAHS